MACSLCDVIIHKDRMNFKFGALRELISRLWMTTSTASRVITSAVKALKRSVPQEIGRAPLGLRRQAFVLGLTLLIYCQEGGQGSDACNSRS